MKKTRGLYHSHCLAAVSLFLMALGFAADAYAAKTSKSVDMTGEWLINDEQTEEIRRSLPEPKEKSGILSGFSKRTNISIGVPGTPMSVPVPGTGNNSSEDTEGAPMQSYGRVAAIEIRQRTDLFGIDYGKKRVSLYNPDETTKEKIDKRKITTSSGWRGDKYIVRKKADDGSKMSEEFELINDGQQLKWTVIDNPKGRPETIDIAIYDRAVQREQGAKAEKASN